MNVLNNDKELNLNDIIMELKKNIKIIILMVIVTALGIFIFSSYVIKPIYQYNLLLRIPPGVDDTQINNCVEIIKNNGDYDLIPKVELIRGTSIIKITFQNENKDIVLENVKKVKPVLKSEIFKVLNDINKQKYSDEITKNIDIDILQINSKLSNYFNGDINIDAVRTDFKLLTEKINLFEKKILEVNIDFINEENNNLIIVYPNIAKNVLIGVMIILVFTSSIILCKHLIKNI